MSLVYSSVVLEDNDWLGDQPFPPCQNDSRQRLPHSLNVPVENSCSTLTRLLYKRHGGREAADNLSLAVFGGIPLLVNFPRLFKNRSPAFITIPSIIILALNCLSPAPYLSSKIQEEALGETRSNLRFALSLCQFGGS